MGDWNKPSVNWIRSESELFKCHRTEQGSAVLISEHARSRLDLSIEPHTDYADITIDHATVCKYKAAPSARSDSELLEYIARDQV